MAQKVILCKILTESQVFMKGKRGKSKMSSGVERESGGGRWRCVLYFDGRWWGGFAMYILK